MELKKVHSIFLWATAIFVVGLLVIIAIDYWSQGQVEKAALVAVADLALFVFFWIIEFPKTVVKK